MTETFARAQAAQLGQELGMKPSIHHRDLMLKAHAQRRIEAMNGYLFVLECDNQVRVDSNLGVYDKISDNIAEVQHKHSGQITLSNYSDQPQTIEFLEITFDS